MIATKFPEQNGELGKPEDMTDEQCYSLPIHKYTDENGYPAIISCWEVTPEDIERMQKTGRLWVNTLGYTLAPFSVRSESPFE